MWISLGNHADLALIFAQTDPELRHHGLACFLVDTDQDGVAKGSVLTSMLKKTDVAVETLMKNYKDGKFPGGTTVNLGLAENGVGLSDFKYTKQDIPAEYLTKIDDIRKKIISGDIKVWDVVSQGYPSFFSK